MTTYLPKHLGIITLALVLSISIQGCDTTQQEGSDDPPGEAIEITDVSSDNIHDKFAQVAEQVPDFGGFYLDENGQPTAYLLDPNPDRAGEVEDALKEAFGEDILQRGDGPRREVDNPQLQLLEGAYSMGDLLSWHDRALGVFEFDEAVFVDLRERENNLTVGIDNLEAQSTIEDYLAGQDIPLEAVNIVEAQRREPHAHDLRSDFSSAQGGIEIGLAGTNSVCSHGYVARFNGNLGFITNSHCTSQRGSVTGTRYENPFSGGQIGVEAADPSYQNCYGGSRSCRKSDAAFIDYDDEASWSAEVARPQDWAGPSSSSATLDIDHGTDLSVRGGKAQPVSGEMVDKVGRTTGWTWGYIQKTCIAIGVNGGSVNGKPIVMRCQYDGSYSSAGGDSGSPVFKWHGDEVTIYGVHWGSGGAFSALQGIYDDF